MLIRLSSEQVVRYWQSIEDALVASLPLEKPLTDEQVLALQRQCVEGALQLWLLYEIRADETGQDRVSPLALGATAMQSSLATGEKELLIYALCSYENVPVEKWQEAFDALRKYAKAQGCIAITALTKVERVKRIVKSLGGNIETVLCRLEV